MKKTDRSSMPLPAEELVFNLPKINRFTLNNGMEALLIRKDNLPIVKINLVSISGSRFDGADKSGLSYFMSMLIDEGAGKRSAFEIEDELEFLGSAMSVSASHDSVVLSLITLKENLEKSLSILADVYKSPQFNDSDFIRERSKLLNKIKQLNDDPGFAASVLLEKYLYEGSYYENPTTGLFSQVENLNNSDIKDYYNNILRKSTTALLVVGDVEQAEVETLLGNYFGREDYSAEIKEKSVPVNPAENRIYLFQRNNSAQSEIRVGNLTSGRGAPDFYSKSLLNTILGGQFSSRINLNLREDKGYTYGANSSFNYHRQSGYFMANTSVETINTVPALKEIFKETEKIDKDISEDELNFARSYLVRRYPSLFETWHQMGNHLINIFLHNLPDNYFNLYVDKLNECTTNELMEAASKNITGREKTVVLVGDIESFRKELDSVEGYKLLNVDDFPG